MEDIYKMKLHDEIIYETGPYGETVIIRVPGGWIYNFTKYSSGGSGGPISVSSTFVPFDNGFEPQQS